MIPNLVHNLTHSHRMATKDNVGQIHLCRSRITGRMDLEVTPYDDDEPVELFDVQPVVVANLARYSTAAGFRRGANLIASGANRTGIAE